MATEGVDLADPYFLHPSDHPELGLVSKVLDGDNYRTWSRAMSISLSAKNKIGYIDGSVEMHSQIDAKYHLWKRCNDMILSWILNSINLDLTNSVIYAKTAAEVWSNLKERFSQGNASRIFQIQREIVEHTQNQTLVAFYFTKLKDFWDELASYDDLPLCTCGAMKKLAEHKQREKVMQFLMGLNDSYDAIRGQILLMQPLATVRQAYSLVLQEQKQRDLAARHDGSTHHAMNVVENNESMRTYWQQNPSRSQGYKGKPLHCKHCNGTNHTIEKCYFIIGFLPGHKLHGKFVKLPNGKGKQPMTNNARSDVPKFTTNEYRQIMALLHGGNSKSCANVAGLNNEEDDCPGQAA